VPASEGLSATSVLLFFGADAVAYMSSVLVNSISVPKKFLEATNYNLRFYSSSPKGFIS
jgi:hypothetical protein